MLGLPLGPAVDTWACATVAFELLGKGKLFDGGSQVPQGQNRRPLKPGCLGWIL